MKKSDAPLQVTPVLVHRPHGRREVTWIDPVTGPNREQRRALSAELRRRRR